MCVYLCSVDSLKEDVISIMKEEKMIIHIKTVETGEDKEHFLLHDDEKLEFFCECIEKYCKGGSDL